MCGLVWGVILGQDRPFRPITSLLDPCYPHDSCPEPFKATHLVCDAVIHLSQSAQRVCPQMSGCMLYPPNLFQPQRARASADHPRLFRSVRCMCLQRMCWQQPPQGTVKSETLGRPNFEISSSIMLPLKAACALSFGHELSSVGEQHVTRYAAHAPVYAPIFGFLLYCPQYIRQT